LETIEILNLFDYPLDVYKTQSNMIYNLKTKYSNTFTSTCNGYIRDKNTVLHSIQQYLNFTKINKTNLVVSNICVKHISQFQFLCILKLFGIKNIQIAPTTLIDSWDNLDKINLELYAKHSINVYSFQSITYGLTSNIFDITTRNVLFNHIVNVIDCGIKHNVKILVFGCPKNRSIINVNDTNDENDAIFIDFFRKLGDYIEEKELIICIENNSRQYNCNYLNTIREVGNIVTKIGHKNIKMMVDIGNAIMENDNLNDIYTYENIIYNIDIARENMKPFIEYENSHREFAKILNDINYNKKNNLEMIINATNCVDELDILCKSLHQFIQLFIINQQSHLYSS
jgi:sugar phosphate isomerase/epimerase